MIFCLPQVSLSIKYLNPFITLVLPSILIILADVISFSLPLGGGERNSFKVTLVLSFTMFLIILNDTLPGGSQCSPIIRQSAHMQTLKTVTLCGKRAAPHESPNVCLCCRTPFLYLSGPPGDEHVAVHGADTRSQRWHLHFLQLYQMVSPRKHCKEKGGG